MFGAHKLDVDLLELYRERFEYPEGSPERAAACERLRVAANAYWSARGRPEQVDGKVDDGMSWAAGVAVALSDDSGVDAADDEW